MTDDLTREAVTQADRAQRAEAEAGLTHDWIDNGCTPPRPPRPPWLPRQRQHHFEPPYSQQEDS